jgi:hypothetical protein
LRTETVAESFATYRSAVIPPGAPESQVEECRRAFYAGSYFLLMNVAHNIGDESTDEDQGIVELEKLKAECENFAARVGMPLPRAEPPPPEPTQHTYVGPEAAEVRTILNDCGRVLRPMMPEGHGFTLIIASYGEGGGLYYISTVEREDSIRMMREFINRQTQ